MKDLLSLPNGLVEEVGADGGVGSGHFKLSEPFFRKCVESLRENTEEVMMLPRVLFHSITDERNKFTIETAAVLIVLFNQQMKGKEAAKMLMEMQIEHNISL